MDAKYMFTSIESMANYALTIVKTLNADTESTDTFLDTIDTIPDKLQELNENIDSIIKYTSKLERFHTRQESTLTEIQDIFSNYLITQERFNRKYLMLLYECEQLLQIIDTSSPDPTNYKLKLDSDLLYNYFLSFKNKINMLNFTQFHSVLDQTNADQTNSDLTNAQFHSVLNQTNSNNAFTSQKIAVSVDDFSEDRIKFDIDTILNLREENFKLRNELERKSIKFKTEMDSMESQLNVERNLRKKADEEKQKAHSLIIPVNEVITRVYNRNYDEAVKMMKARNLERDTLSIMDLVEYPHDNAYNESLGNFIFNVFKNKNINRGKQVLLEMIKCFDFGNVQTIIENEKMPIILLPKQILSNDLANLLTMYSNVKRYSIDLPGFLHSFILKKEIIQLPELHFHMFNRKKLSNVTILNEETMRNLERGKKYMEALK